MRFLERRPLTLVFLLLATCLASCGSDSYEKIFADSTDLNNAVADMMEGIADGSIDNDEALSIMDDLEKTKASIDKRMSKLGAPTQEEFSKILQSEELRKSLARLAPAMIKAVSSGKISVEIAKRMSALAGKTK